MTIDLDEIEAAARGAQTENSEDWWGLHDLIWLSIPSVDAHYIATMDPATILALVKRVRELEAEVARQRARDERSSETAGL